MNDQQKGLLRDAATALRLEARWYWDRYKRSADSTSKTVISEGLKAYENYQQMTRIANELDNIADW